MMTMEHSNVSLVKRLDPGNIAGCADLFAGNFVWHFFNPSLPHVQGDYVGLEGLQTFFAQLEMLTEGSFQVEPLSIFACGDELVVTHVKDRMILEGRSIEIDAVVVWRIIDDRIVEAWDIPSIYTERLQTAA